ncbi:hypothetical protein DPEC_G00106150 [Dallia pectoralis]|uniref:Uncharacterized protein n=1 Tax=Dallia pectoralis TaxID=75939 RepID=A0ACC2GXX9_DALPE|nr:hypothetical protein DPEC_G00106150 [Dallia pectoralis]
MAEARRADEDETTRGENRDPVVRRQPRPNCSGERSERHKEQRLSQGPLSSLRAAIKWTSTGSSSQSENSSRDRRRPEITIVSAEPLASNTWFPGASGGFPPPPPPAATIWGSSIPPVILPPPTYDEVIKEKRQEQIPPPSSSPASETSVSTTTIATQTDLRPASSAPIYRGSVARRPPKPPRPSYPFTTKPLHANDTATASVSLSHVPLEDPPVGSHTLKPEETTPAEILHDLLTPEPVCHLTSASSCQTDQWEQSSVLPSHSKVALTTPSDPPAQTRPQPRPRTKRTLRPIRREVDVQTLVRLGETGSEVTENQEGTHPGGKYLQELLDAFSSDDWGFPDSQSNSEVETESGGEEEEEEEEDMSTLRARIQAFEQQQTGQVLGKPPDGNHGDGTFPEVGRPEPRPRVQLPSKPAPPIAPKPHLAAKTSCKGPWEEKGPPAEEVYNSADDATPPITSDLPAEPPTPVPAPRPLIPKRTRSEPQKSDPPPEKCEENPPGPRLPPRPPVATRTSPVVVPEERSSVIGQPTPAGPPKPSTELQPRSDIRTTGHSKPGVGPKPGTTPSPSRQRVPVSEPSGPQKSPSLVSKVCSQARPAETKLPSVPPAPAHRKTPSISADSQPTLPPRPQAGVKFLPLRPPPIKSVPGRPPPPQAVSTAASLSANQPPSSAAVPAALTTPPANQPQGQRTTKRGPPLPPRPKPGHPLYKSYMVNSQKPDVLVLLEETGPAPKDSLLRPDSGPVQPSNVSANKPWSDQSQPPETNPAPEDKSPSKPLSKNDNSQSESISDDNNSQSESISDDNKSQSEPISDEISHTAPPSILPSSLICGQKIQPISTTVSGPRCVARFDYEGEERDELTFITGDVIALTEVIGEDWGRGQIHGRTGIFPLAFTDVIEEPPKSTGKQVIAETTAEPIESIESTDKWLVALYDFPGQTAEDLCFQQGALIRVTQCVDAEWARGRTQEGREGLFPTAFCAAQLMTGKPVARGVARGVARVKFDFTAESEDELSLKAGDMVEDLESLDEEWFIVNAAGRRGLVPKNYLTLLPNTHTHNA